jgi:16S rRNA (cytosine967-C5)-methyltransferase
LTQPRISPARSVAFNVLLRTETGGYASDLLMAQSAALDSRDAGLASEIVFGCLRRQPQLDAVLASRLGTRQLDPEVRIILRMGAYQLRHLDRVPAYAVVGESVELVKQAGKDSAAGLVNAILRRLTRKPVQWTDRATALCMPEWILQRWDAHYGRQTADGIARAALEKPETSIASTGRTQDIGAQSIVPLLAIEPGMTFLDVCAAPGNKTAQAIEAGAQAVACDLYRRRLSALRGLPCAKVVLDATLALPFRSRFDRILVDAPCSGTGTLGRNPEIRYRLNQQDLATHRTRQIAILRNALRLVQPGGRLVYSTCSLEKEENEDVIAECPGAWRTGMRIPGQEPGDGFFFAVLTC